MALRVAIFTLEFPPAFSGGLGVHVFGLVKYLRRQGDAVDVFYLGPPPAPMGTIQLPAFEGYPPSAEIDAKWVPGGETVLSRHANEPYDIIHCHDWHGGLPAALLWQRGVPMITTCHLPAATPFHYPGERPTEFAMLLEFVALRLSRVVIAVSQFVAREMERKYRAFADKIRVILNGTDTAWFSGTSGSREQLILAAGRLTTQKGFLDLLEIFASVHRNAPQARLRIVGSGPDERMLSEAILDSSAVSAMELLPFSDRSALRSHYQQARVLAVPSVYEPFGLVAIEAMACGTPVVAYGTGGLPEIITDGIDGIMIGPNDRHEFASALTRLLRDPLRAECLGARARQTVLNRFNDEVSYARTRALYRE